MTAPDLDREFAEKVGRFVIWLEAGNGNNFMQSICSAIINSAEEWHKNHMEESHERKDNEHADFNHRPSEPGARDS